MTQWKNNKSLMGSRYDCFISIGDEPIARIYKKEHGDLIVTAVNSHEELLEALGNIGDGVTDMFEQLTRGNWVDDHGHSVLLNAEMIALQNNIQEAQAAIKSARGQQ